MALGDHLITDGNARRLAVIRILALIGGAIDRYAAGRTSPRYRVRQVRRGLPNKSANSAPPPGGHRKTLNPVPNFAPFRGPFKTQTCAPSSRLVCGRSQLTPEIWH